MPTWALHGLNKTEGVRDAKTTQILGDGNADWLRDVPVDRASDVQTEEKRGRVENGTPCSERAGVFACLCEKRLYSSVL